MVGIYVFTDPSKDSREKLTWSALGELDFSSDFLYAPYEQVLSQQKLFCALETHHYEILGPRIHP